MSGFKVLLETFTSKRGQMNFQAFIFRRFVGAFFKNRKLTLGNAKARTQTLAFAERRSANSTAPLNGVPLVALHIAEHYGRPQFR